MKILFVEPPKDVWFVMGEYLPPPYGIIQLAAFLEKKVENIEIEIIDCNAQQIDWHNLKTKIASSNPDVVASSSLSTCNTYATMRALETAKTANPDTITVTGGQHFTAMAEESLQTYPEVDIIVRNEGEETLAELIENLKAKSSISLTKGISFRQEGKIVHNPSRPLIENIEELPFPGYHLVKDIVHKYHFAGMMSRDAPYALVEGSRGCTHNCRFCTQCQHWQHTWRPKSAKRIADEIEYCYRNFGSRFIWLTDDNFGSGSRPSEIAEEIIVRGMGDDLSWFVQSRCDDVARNEQILPRLRKSGLSWVLLGVENSELSTLQSFRKGITPQDASTAVNCLKKNGIFAHAMFIIGERKDSVESIKRLRAFANDLDPDLAMFGVLTPFPGTEVFEEAKRNGWIKDFNWSHYDMVHAIMPTETLSVNQVQEELYGCYREFYGSWKRRFQGFFSSNELKRKIFLHMARTGIIEQLRKLY